MYNHDFKILLIIINSNTKIIMLTVVLMTITLPFLLSLLPQWLLALPYDQQLLPLTAD